VVGLEMGLEDGVDPRPLPFGERNVFVDQVGVGVDDGERALGLAAQQIRGARRLIDEQLAEEHGASPWSVS
jgi:hypothetical protein